MLKIVNENYKGKTVEEVCKQFQDIFYEFFPESYCTVTNVFHQSWSGENRPTGTLIDFGLEFEPQQERGGNGRIPDIFINLGLYFTIYPSDLDMDDVIPNDAKIAMKIKDGFIRLSPNYKVDCSNLPSADEIILSQRLDTLLSEWEVYLSCLQDKLIGLDEEGLLSDEQSRKLWGK